MGVINEYADLIVAISAVIIAYVLLFQVFLTQQSNRQGRRSRTFDLILHLDITRPDVFNNLDKIPDLNRLSRRQFDSSDEKDFYREVISYLNSLEAIAIGVKEGFYDEDILNEYMGHTLVTTYRNTQKLIDGIREYSNNPRVFVHMEAIARRWEGKMVY